MTSQQSAPTLALSARGCCKRYGAAWALSGVDLDVREGELTALLGPNGSGKSTLLHGVVGLHDFDRGTVAVGGHPHRSVAAKQLVGFVPDELPIPQSLTGREYLEHLRRLRRQPSSELATALIDALSLGPHVDKFIADMSHGTKKKLQIVGAASTVPALLIMDEPFRGLDPHAVRTIRLVVDELRSAGTAALVATHDILAAEQWFDRVIVMHDGAVIADDAPSRLGAAGPGGDLESFFLEATGHPGHRGDDARLRRLIHDDDRTPSS